MRFKRFMYIFVGNICIFYDWFYSTVVVVEAFENIASIHLLMDTNQFFNQ